jgi:pimeloyl-ACP methyl ester carboxylesterase
MTGLVGLVALAVLATAVVVLVTGGKASVPTHRNANATTKARSGPTHADPPATASGEVPASPPPPASGTDPPYTVEARAVRLFDPTRQTPARGDIPAAAGRLLVTDLYVPSGASGPLPLVVFAHGWNSDPGVYRTLLDLWAAAGFLVAAPVFPDSTDLYSGAPVSDYANQALDLSFVITSLLRDLSLRIDPTRIAVAGHSDGGTDVALMALDSAYADARVRAYVCMAGQMPSGVASYSVAASRAALLVAVGTNDEYGLYPLAGQVFQAARTSSKTELVESGGDHLGSFLDATPAAAAMRDQTTRFLELALEPKPPSSAAVVAALGQVPEPDLTVIAP